MSSGVDGEKPKPGPQSRKPDDDEYDEINSKIQNSKYLADRADTKRNKHPKHHKKSGGKDQDLSHLTSLSGGGGISKPDPGAFGRKKNKKGK